MDWKPEDSLWKTIQRYDAYFGTTNNKATFLIAYYTFSLGFLAVQLGNIDLIAPIGAPAARIAFLVLATLVAITTVLAFVFVLRVVMPYLRSNKRPGVYHSMIYYSDVAEDESADAYYERVKALTADKVVEDLSRQVHVLAQGLKAKFTQLRTAINLTLWLQLPLLCVFVVFIIVRRY